MWQQVIQPFVDAGKLTVVGVVQEQHPGRARLYAQWREIGWPILVDSLNVLDLSLVPVPVALDASGIVRHVNIRPNRFAMKFMEMDYPATPLPPDYNLMQPQNAGDLRDAAEQAASASAWRTLGDALFLAAGPAKGGGNAAVSKLSEAIEAYEKALAIDPADGRAHFRLGVALRRRSEMRGRRAGDAQAAVEQWGLALSNNPNQYIWRRRIQQYGPRLDKPYAFYTWVDEARREIIARGETPVALRIEPSGSEIAAPQRKHSKGEGQTSAANQVVDASEERIGRDAQAFVKIEPVVTPARVKPGKRVRVRVVLRLNERSRPYWNNESKDVVVRVVLPKGFALGEGSLRYPNPSAAESQEDRAIEFELAVPEDAASGAVNIPAYALYYVCENKGGKCRYLRGDFTVALTVDPGAPAVR